MKKKQHITAFYLETLLMIVVFISIILVLTRVFGGARARSVQAKRLTAAVTLAQNAAEAVSASSDPQELYGLLNEEGNAVLQEDASTGQALVSAVYDLDMKPVPLPAEDLQTVQDGTSGTAGVAESLLQRGDLIVETAWNPEEGDRGLVDAIITVFNGHSGEAVFSLETSVYLPAQE